MSSFTGPEASEFFSRYLATISGESDRGAVLVAAALLDEGLELALKKKLAPATKKNDPLFDGGHSPLRSFSAKIELAFRLGLITHNTRKMLDSFRDLRNAFAHGAEPVSLSDTKVKDRVQAIFGHQSELHSAIVGTFEEIVQKEPSWTLSVEDVLRSGQGQRSLFDVFFAANAMALQRLQMEVEPITELSTPNPNSESHKKGPNLNPE
eukprot:gene7096-9038_t